VTLTSTSYTRRYYDEHVAAGLDYAVYGDWQRDYGRWFVDALGLRGRVLLDVGCACGALAHGFEEAGAVLCHGVDLCEHMIQAGRNRWPTLRLDVCDCVNLHLFNDATFDAIHSAQVAEHWQPHLVPCIFLELRRAIRMGGLFFCCMDTVELFQRQGRDMLREDPTHVCIRPLAWWDEQAEANGWQRDVDAQSALREHPRSYIGRYDWDYRCWRAT